MKRDQGNSMRIKKQMTVVVLGLLIITIFAAIGARTFIRSNAATPTASTEAESGTVSSVASTVTSSAASAGGAIKFGSGAPIGNCVVTAQLVNPCRPWYGAWVGSYPQVANTRVAQVAYHEQRTGRQMDVVHFYHGVGSNTLSADEKTYINRANTYVFANWKLTDTWAQGADANNASITSLIDQMATSVKSVAPHKMFLTLYHEPENNITPANTTCPANKYSDSGTPAQYVAMWHRVHDRFAADGVTNVVWAVNYMGFSQTACLIKPLYPGNAYVDWIMWDPYSHTQTYTKMMNYFYNWLSTNSDATYNFNSKAWGIAEMGTIDMAPATMYQFYEDAATAVRNNTYPKIKMYLDFDDIGTTGEHRTSYDSDSTFDAAAQTHFNAFSNAIMDHGN